MRRSEAVNFFGISIVCEFSGREFGERTARIEGYVCLCIYIYICIYVHNYTYGSAFVFVFGFV